ncbi:MAG: MerC domain-containing protein [Deltaproteobacteria bacterium]|nr:MerC domain-containing protein [Deltaproteobacteria bacterium]
MESARVDRLGIVASTVCAVHCALGFVLVGASGVGRVFANKQLEVIFVSFAVLLAVSALGLGARRHRRAAPLALGLCGIATLGLSRGMEFRAEYVEVLLSLVGTSFLITAHVFNLRFLRQLDACCAPVSAATAVSSGE